MMRQVSVLAAASILIFVAGCQNRSDSTLPSTDTSSTAGMGSGGSGMDSSASTSGADLGGGGSLMGSGPEGLLLSQLIVYFDYDRSDIKPEFNAMLAAHGQYLASNPNAQVRLEGHTDERGSREYNIGLGERRAQSVRRVLLLQGAAASQITTVSYGEERPAVLGSDEEAWSLNRRVEIVYRQ